MKPIALHVQKVAGISGSEAHLLSLLPRLRDRGWDVRFLMLHEDEPGAWEFAREGEVLRLDPPGPLVVGIGAATDLGVDAARAGTGIVYLFEDWLRPFMDRGELEPVLQPWWPSFSGPFLYYPGHRHVPAPLRAFIDFTRAMRW